MTLSPSDVVDRIIKSASEAVVRLRVRSALNPLLWLCGLIGLPAIGGAILANDGPQIVFFVLAGIPLLATCCAFVYFMIRDPDKLQSEEYQIQKKVLDIIEEKGSNVTILATSLEAIANPHLRQLPRGSEGGEQ